MLRIFLANNKTSESEIAEIVLELNSLTPEQHENEISSFLSSDKFYSVVESFHVDALILKANDEQKKVLESFEELFYDVLLRDSGLDNPSIHTDSVFPDSNQQFPQIYSQTPANAFNQSACFFQPSAPQNLGMPNNIPQFNYTNPNNGGTPNFNNLYAEHFIQNSHKIIQDILKNTANTSVSDSGIKKYEFATTLIKYLGLEPSDYNPPQTIIIFFSSADKANKFNAHIRNHLPSQSRGSSVENRNLAFTLTETSKFLFSVVTDENCLCNQNTCCRPITYLSNETLALPEDTMTEKLIGALKGKHSEKAGNLLLHYHKDYNRASNEFPENMSQNSAINRMSQPLISSLQQEDSENSSETPGSTGPIF